MSPLFARSAIQFSEIDAAFRQRGLHLTYFVPGVKNFFLAAVPGLGPVGLSLQEGRSSTAAARVRQELSFWGAWLPAVRRGPLAV